MKTFRKIMVTFALLSLCLIGHAYNVNSMGDDTIKIVLGNSSEIKIVVDDPNDKEKIQSEIDAVLQSLNEVFDQLNVTEINADTTVSVNIKIDNDEIVIETEEDTIYDEYIYEEFDYDDSEYTYDEEYERYWDQYTQKKEKKKDKVVRYKMYFDFGFNNYLENGSFPSDHDAQYAVKPFGSWNVGFGGLLRIQVAKPFSIDLGYGLSWYNFKYQDKSTQVVKTDEGVEFVKRDVDANFLKSKTTVPYMNLNLTPMFHISKSDDYYGGRHFKMRIGAGVYAGYRLGGKVKYHYVLDNISNKYKDRETNYYLSSFRYGVKAIVGFGNNFDIYATYDLNTLYAKDKGPKLNPICFGISLTF